MATRKNKSADVEQIRTLVPRDVDSKYLGDEPLFATQPEASRRTSALSMGLAWYHRFYGKKDAKDMLSQYLDVHGRTADAKVMRTVADNEFVMPTYAWLSRLVLRGLQLTEAENASLQSEITRLLMTIHKPEVKVVSASGGNKVDKDPEAGPTRQNIQEIMREKASEAAGELEGLFDEFILTGAAAKHNLRPIDEVAKKNVMPQHISILTEVWKKKQDEFSAVLEGTDAQLVQGYARFTKTQIKNIIKFIELVLTDLSSYVTVKKVARAPRKVKAVPVEKIVSKLKYLKVFKDVAMKLDLVSISPVKLHGASEAWLFDTAKRKLIHLIADEYSKTFTVKGNTLLGFDVVKSEIKTLRKPGEQIKGVMGSKPAARKFFDEIKSVATAPTGRFNDAIIILKAW